MRLIVDFKQDVRIAFIDRCYLLPEGDTISVGEAPRAAALPRLAPGIGPLQIQYDVEFEGGQSVNRVFDEGLVLSRRAGIAWRAIKPETFRDRKPHRIGAPVGPRRAAGTRSHKGKVLLIERPLA